MPKSTVLQMFGKGKIRYTNYDCGFHSNDQPNPPYYQRLYDGFNYIGSDKERFVLEELTFDAERNLKLEYNGKALTGGTTIEEFIQIIGHPARQYFKEHPKENSILLMQFDGDDGIRFEFKNGKLAKFQYWSPC